MAKVPCIKTAGELKQALKDIPDETPLAVDDHGEGWGLKPPYLAMYSWETMDHYGYCTEEEAAKKRKPNQAALHKLPRPVCVIESGTEHF